jgi:beta-mannosidase
VFDGLDTFATVRFCGRTVASTSNQFRQYTFDITYAVQNCNSSAGIDIEFAPATAAAVSAAQNGSCPLCLGINYEFPDIQYIRKQQCDFGWDWAPAFSPAGIWKSMRIVQSVNSEIYVQNSMVDIYRLGQLNNLPPDQSQPWVVNVSVDYIGHLPSRASMQMQISGMDYSTVTKKKLLNVTISGNTTGGRITGAMLVTEQVELWWPVGYGNQSLYNISIQVMDSQNLTMASVEKRTGFRTVVLDQTHISDFDIAVGIAPGNKWNFEINGHEIYCKGSNFLPPDAFWPRVTKERMQMLFQSAVDSVCILSSLTKGLLMRA